MDRLDDLISDIRKRFHKPAMSAGKDDTPCADVLLVAHGHILRAFAMRWIGRQLTDGVSLLLEGESGILFQEEIHIGRWNDRGQCWKRNGRRFYRLTYDQPEAWGR